MLWAVQRINDYIAAPSLEAAVAILEDGDLIRPWFFGPQDHTRELETFLDFWDPQGRGQ